MLKLAEDLLNININKEKQFIDWRKRPLDADELAYAMNDVKYLIPLFKRIKKKINNYDLKKIKSHHKKIIKKALYIDKEKKELGKRLDSNLTIKQNLIN